MEVLFPFGHGLSYTTFAYRDLALTLEGETVTATFKVKNTGTVAGKEIVQLYVRGRDRGQPQPGPARLCFL
ncbi:MAG: hypothetical protein MUC85_11660 [Anaerolineales bacterium]|nr:hypothetical protein [Anaerolineales bacterium]